MEMMAPVDPSFPAWRQMLIQSCHESLVGASVGSSTKSFRPFPSRARNLRWLDAFLAKVFSWVAVISSSSVVDATSKHLLRWVGLERALEA